MRHGVICALMGLAARQCLGDILPVNDFEGYQNGIYGTPPQQKFRSSNITAPIFNSVTFRNDLITGPGTADGSDHLFLTLGYDVQAASGPYIFRDDDLSLVYANPSFDYAMNARVQRLDGKDYLTFWHGARNRGDSQGFCVGYDENYRLIWNVTLGAPFAVDADMHECEVTPDGTVLVTAYQTKKFDLTALGGKVEDVMADGCFQEVDLRNEVLFSWCASDWFEVGLGYWNVIGPTPRRRDVADDEGDTTYTTSSGFDVYHINSLQKVRPNEECRRLDDVVKTGEADSRPDERRQLPCLAPQL